MRFVILTQYYPPEVGAPQVRLSELARRFAERGHSVTVLTAMPNYPAGHIQPGYGGAYRKEIRDGVEIIRTFIYPTHRADFVFRMANYLSFVVSSALVGTLVLGRADYILVESPPLFLGLSGIWLSRLKRARLIFNVSDLWPESVVRLGKLRRGSYAHRLNLWLEGVCYRNAWLVTGQSRGILSDVEARVPATRRFLVSNGVDTSLFADAERSEALRQELSRGRRYVAVYAGLLGLAQGLEQVLYAAALLKGNPDLMLTFVGEGPAKEPLQKKAHALGLTNVQFLPTRARAEIPALVASADVMLATLGVQLPGAVPSKIYDAMGGGVPLLLAAEGEPAEIVRETGCGLVVPIGDAEAFASTLRRLFSDSSLRGRLGRNGRTAAETRFGRDRIAAEFIGYLEAQLRQPGLSPKEEAEHVPRGPSPSC